MNNIYEFVYGRCTMNGSWQIIDDSRLNKLYYVNNGYAKIHNGSKEYMLTAGNVYLFPQCNDIKAIDSENFDHTFFDFISRDVYRLDVFAEIKGLDDYFSFANRLIKAGKKHNTALGTLLEGMIEYINTEYKIPMLKNEILIKAVDMIYQKGGMITTQKLAERLNINESHFIRIFKKNMGTTPMKYIQSYRLAEGMRLLKEGYAVSDAARKCGYESPSAFCVAFSKKYGFVPSEV